MSFKDFSAAQKTPKEDTAAIKSKSTLDALEPAKPSDKDAASVAPAAKG